MTAVLEQPRRDTIWTRSLSFLEARQDESGIGLTDSEWTGIRVMYKIWDRRFTIKPTLKFVELIS